MRKDGTAIANIDIRGSCRECGDPATVIWYYTEKLSDRFVPWAMEIEQEKQAVYCVDCARGLELVNGTMKSPDEWVEHHWANNTTHWLAMEGECWNW